MKTLMKITMLVVALSSSMSLANKPLVETDSDDLYRVGSNSQITHGAKVKLPPGLYETGPIDEYFGEDYYLLVDNYVNDEDKLIAILFPKNAIGYEAYKSSTAQLYQGRSIKGGEVLMFSPITVDNSGNLRTLSEMQTNAPVLEVMSREGRYRYPYLIRPRNSALKGRLFGLKGASEKAPELKPYPSSGVFASATGDRVDLLVSGSEVSIHSGSMVDQTFNLVGLNGNRGKFSALTKSTLDTMAESELADERIQRIASFVNGCFDEEKMFILTPTIRLGEYKLEIFQLAQPNIFEWLFPGRRAPKSAEPKQSYNNSASSNSND